jgi:hypothetical protein
MAGKPVADSSSVEDQFLSNTYCEHENVAEEPVFGTLNLVNGDSKALRLALAGLKRVNLVVQKLHPALDLEFTVEK